MPAPASVARPTSWRSKSVTFVAVAGELVHAGGTDQAATDDDDVGRRVHHREAGSCGVAGHVHRAVGQAALHVVDVDDHRDAEAVGVDGLLAFGAVVEHDVAHVGIVVDPPAALDLQEGAGGGVAVEEAEPGRVGKGADETALRVADPEGDLVGAVHLGGAPQRQLGLPVAVDVGGDDRGAVVERPVDGVAIAPSSATGGGRRRRAGSERLLRLGDPAVAVEAEGEGGGAEHRPGRQRRRDLHHVTVDDRIRPRRRGEHRLSPAQAVEHRVAPGTASRAGCWRSRRRRALVAERGVRVVGPARRGLEVTTYGFVLGHRRRLCRAAGLRPGRDGRTALAAAPPPSAESSEENHRAYASEVFARHKGRRQEADPTPRRDQEGDRPGHRTEAVCERVDRDTARRARSHPRGVSSGDALTTSLGVKVDDTDNSLRVGSRGPTLLEDFHLREKIMHFDHERIPERVVHARGAGAHGQFRALRNRSRTSPAPTSCRHASAARRCSCASRRSPARAARPTPPATCAASRRSSTRDEGNFDLVGNNIPVFFIQDGIKFPDLIHAAKPEPDREIPQAQTAHDYVLGLRVAARPSRPTC